MVVLLMASGSILSCENLGQPEVPAKTPTVLFDEVWRIVNENYSLFPYVPINWDSVRTVYEPQFFDRMNENLLYTRLTDMVFELGDAHTTIEPLGSIPWRWLPSKSTNFNTQIVADRYIAPLNPVRVSNYYSYNRLTRGSAYVGYMRLSSFGPINENSFLDMMNSFRDAKGLIIDIRDNSGGDNAGAQMILSHFTASTIEVGSTKYKNGKGHNEFTAFYTVTVEPKEPYFDKRVVLLINNIVYSSANDMAMWASVFPNFTLMGDTTRGGIGSPVSRILANGWRLQTSASVFRLPDGRILPNGMPPDVQVSATYQNGRDEIIEAALDFLLN